MAASPDNSRALVRSADDARVRAHTSQVRLLVLAVLMTCWAGMPASAGTVHKWVDAKGITHYSDTPPEIAPAQLTQIEVSNVVGTADKTTSDYYSIANQWQRMHRERLELDRLALEREKQKAARQPPAPEVVYVERPDENSRQVIYLGTPRLRHRNYRSHDGAGRHYRHGHRKPVGGTRQTGNNPGRTSLGYFRQVH